MIRPNARRNHATLFKNRGKNSDNLRRKRDDVLVTLRKKKKDEILSKRRNISARDLEESTDISTSLTLDEIKSGVFSEYPSVVADATRAARRMLSIHQDQCIDDFTDPPLVSRFVELLSRSDEPDLQLEASWVLTNIASGTSEQTRAVVRAGATEGLLALTGSPREDVVTQAVWGLGNIVGDVTEFRDRFERGRGVEVLVALASRRESGRELALNVAWLVTNFFRASDPRLPLEVIRKFVPALSGMLIRDDALSDTCWAIFYLSEHSVETFQEIVEAGMIPTLTALLGHEDIGVATPCLKILGNVVTGSDAQTGVVIDAGALPRMRALFARANQSMLKELCWAISNVTAGTRNQVQAVIDAGILANLVQVLTSETFAPQKEVAWAVSNLCAEGTRDQVESMIEAGVVKPFVDFLANNRNKVVLAFMEGIEAIISIGLSGKHSLIIEESNAEDKIESFTLHENDAISSKAEEILKLFPQIDE